MRSNLSTQLRKESQGLIERLAGWSSGSGAGLDTYIIVGLMISSRFDDISRAHIDRAITDLHRNNDADASEVAEQLDRWYYDRLVEFRIRST